MDSSSVLDAPLDDPSVCIYRVICAILYMDCATESGNDMSGLAEDFESGWVAFWCCECRRLDDRVCHECGLCWPCCDRGSQLVVVGKMETAKAIDS
jgi:hypothetical protein